MKRSFFETSHQLFPACFYLPPRPNLPCRPPPQHTMKLSLKPIFNGLKSKSRSLSGRRSAASSSSSSSSAAALVVRARSWSEGDPAGAAVEAADVFKLLDQDGDGKISRPELELVFHRLGVAAGDEELSQIVAAADLDGDGCISLEEFEELSSRLGPAGDDELQETFEYYDADGDGKISAEELLGVFTSIGEDGCTIDDCRRMIVGVDSDGDGFVCFQDFLRMMMIPTQI